MPTLTWRSWNVAISSSTAVASVVNDEGGTTADVRLYESTNDDGVTEGSLFADYTTTALAPAAANWDVTTSGIWYRASGPDWDKPAVGKSSIARGSDPDETSTPSPTGVFDLQLQTPNSAKLTVAAFVVPVAGSYVVSGLFARRAVPWAWGTATFKTFDPSAMLLTSITAGTAGSGDPAWKADPGAGSYSLGALTVGQKVYFALDYDGAPDNDATEIAWTIVATVADPAVDVDADPATSTAVGYPVVPVVAVRAGSGSVAAVGLQPKARPRPRPGVVSGIGAAYGATVQTSTIVQAAAGSGSGVDASTLTAADAAATSAEGSVVGHDATASTATDAQVATATATGDAHDATTSSSLTITADVATADTTSADVTAATLLRSQTSTGTGVAVDASTASQQLADVPAQTALSTGLAYVVDSSIRVVVDVASSDGRAHAASTSASVSVTAGADAAVASASATDAALTVAVAGVAALSTGIVAETSRFVSLRATAALSDVAAFDLTVGLLLAARAVDVLGAANDVSTLADVVAAVSTAAVHAFDARVNYVTFDQYCIAVSVVADRAGLSVTTDQVAAAVTADTATLGVLSDASIAAVVADYVAVGVTVCE